MIKFTKLIKRYKRELALIETLKVANSGNTARVSIFQKLWCVKWYAEVIDPILSCSSDAKSLVVYCQVLANLSQLLCVTYW